VTEPEFRRNVWPALPASRPEVNMPADYVWQDTHTRSLHALTGTLDRFGGQRLRLGAVQFGGASTNYGPFRIHRKTRLTVHDANGAPVDIRIFGSLLETDAGWKVFSYVVD
jgi:hypothetical protein